VERENIIRERGGELENRKKIFKMDWKMGRAHATAPSSFSFLNKLTQGERDSDKQIDR
jgi:hypothetical protein